MRDNETSAQLDIIDIKDKFKVISQNDLDLKSFGFSKAQVANSKNIYLLSERGYAKLLKILEGQRSICSKLHTSFSIISYNSIGLVFSTSHGRKLDSETSAENWAHLTAEKSAVNFSPKLGTTIYYLLNLHTLTTVKTQIWGLMVIYCLLNLHALTTTSADLRSSDFIGLGQKSPLQPEIPFW